MRPLSLDALRRIVRGYFFMMPADLTEGCDQQVTINELVGCNLTQVCQAFNATEQEVQLWMECGMRFE